MIKIKEYTRILENRRFVIYDYKWVSVDRFPMTEDLKGNLISFTANIRQKDFYYVDWNWRTDSEKGIVRTHGKYALRDIRESYYSVINHEKFWSEFNRIIADPEFNIGFNQKFIDECKELINPLLRKNNEIIWLEIPKDKELEKFAQYDYWEEFWIRDFVNDELILIVFGDD